MNWIDFFTGFTLMNAMPHLVLGTWKVRMFSAFGFGNTQNKIYAWLCLGTSLGLFRYQYAWSELPHHGMYSGALLLLLIYFLTGWFWYRLFASEHKKNSYLRGVQAIQFQTSHSCVHVRYY